MPKFRVTETVVYIVDAEDEDHAHDIIVNSEDLTEYFCDVIERRFEELEVV